MAETEPIAMYGYSCLSCGRQWRQENFFQDEICVYCGSTDTLCTEMTVLHAPTFRREKPDADN